MQQRFPILAAKEDAEAAGALRAARLFAIALVLAAVSAAYAVFCARDLVYDGAYYLLALARHGQVQLFEPPRAAAQILQQSFAVLAARAGVHDLVALGRFLSLGMSGWPVALTAASWFVLPRSEKAWITGPLVNLIAVMPATSFIGVGEGLIASCLLWLVFFLVLFRTRSPAGGVAAILLTLVCACAHEASFVFMGGLGCLALWRARRAGGFERLVLVALALAAAAASLHLFAWVVSPRSVVERSNFLVSLLGGFLGTPQAPNLPALASLVALFAIVAVYIRGPARARGTVAVALALFAAAAILVLVDGDGVLAPSRYFAARGLPLIGTTALAFGLFLLDRRGIPPARLVTPPAALILLGLLLTQTTMQLAMTARWEAYTQDMRVLVSRPRGAIAFADASRMINPAGTRFRAELLKSWSVEPLSIVLAPGGLVLSVLEPKPGEPFVPYRLDRPNDFPRVPGLDWSHFSARNGPNS